jgi:hypothetical protein
MPHYLAAIRYADYYAIILAFRLFHISAITISRLFRLRHFFIAISFAFITPFRLLSAIAISPGYCHFRFDDITL